MRRVLSASLATALAVPLALLAGAPASAAPAVTTWAELVSAFAAAGSAPEVVLGADITAPVNARLVAPDGAPVILDLAGHDLTIPDPVTYQAGIGVGSLAELTLRGTGGGTLTVQGGGRAPGIGGDGGNDLTFSGVHTVLGGSAGLITIEGGTIVATGGNGAPGIGGGWSGAALGVPTAIGGAGGTVTVSGGSVTAVGGTDAPGIGGGTAVALGDSAVAIGGSGGLLTISGGAVTATGSGLAAGIGGGGAQVVGTPTAVVAIGGAGAEVVMTGGRLTATGGTGRPGVGAAGAVAEGAIALSGTAGTVTLHGTAGLPAPSDAGGTGTPGAPIDTPTTPAGIGFRATAAPSSIEIVFHYLVTFDVASGTGSAPDQTVDDGELASEPVEPSRAGFVFAGWRVGTETGPVYDFADPVTAPVTLVAAWEAVLAETGLDAAAPLGLGALLLTAGAAALLARRRMRGAVR